MNGLSSAIKMVKGMQSLRTFWQADRGASRAEPDKCYIKPLRFELPNDIRQTPQLKGAVSVSRTIDEAI